VRLCVCCLSARAVTLVCDYDVCGYVRCDNCQSFNCVC
jgi:hypothetical protein